jgi:hypothetical protein
LRDLDSIFAYCGNLKSRILAGIIHIGFENIHYFKIDPEKFKISGTLFVTESARWCLIDYIQYHDRPFLVGGDLAIYAILSGLGYIEDRDQIALWIDSNKPKILNDEYDIFQSQLPYVPEHSIQRLIEILPNEVLESSTSALDLSVRSGHVIEREEILKIGDLKKYSDENIMAFKNLGKKSYYEIRNEIITYSFQLLESHGKIKLPFKSHDENLTSSLITIPKTKIIDASDFESSSVIDFSHLLDDREYEILKIRATNSSSGNTYQIIGNKYGITRERARQIIHQSINKITKNHLFQKFISHIRSLVIGRDLPLPVSGLHVVADNRWGKFESDLLPYILNVGDKLNVYAIEIYGEAYISDISQQQFDSIINNAIEIIGSAYINQRFSKEWLNNYVISETREFGKSFRSVILREITEEFEFSVSELDSNSYVLGKKGVKSKIMGIIDSSPIPLHYSVIHSRYVNLWGNISERSIHATVQKLGGIILFSRGTFGISKHFTVTENEIQDVLDAVIPYMNEAPNKQWHAAEIYEYLVDSDFRLINEIDLYILSEILKRSELLSSLRRHVFQLKCANEKLGTRIQVYQAIESLLIEAGRPMLSDEIKKAIATDRGLGVVFQIMSTDRVIKVADKKWGLFDRDINLNMSEIFKYVQVVKVYLDVKQCGIHISELNALFATHDLFQIDPVLAVSLCQRIDSAIKISPSEYLYLSVWGNPRRKSASEAIKEVFKNHSKPLTSKDIHGLAMAILGRNISQDRIYGPMAALGVKYDESTALWSLPTDTENIFDEN